MVSGVHTINENHGVEMIWLNFTNLQTVENYFLIPVNLIKNISAL